MVLGAGDEDLRLVMDNVALFQKAGVGVPAPEWCDVWLGRDTVAQLDEHSKETVEVLGEAGGVRPEQTWCGAQKPKHWKVAEAEAEAAPNLQHAGVVLADLGVPWKDGVVDGDEGRDPEAEGVVANGGPRFANECATQG